jgi:hypothetical protein
MTTDDLPPLTAIFYDGRSNRKRRVELRPGETIEIVEDGTVLASWIVDDIRVADGDMALRLSSVSAPPLARLEINDESIASRLRHFLPRLDETQEKRQTGRIVGWSLGAAGSIALMVVYGIPFAADRLAPHVPVNIEKRLGETVDRQFLNLTGAQTCTDGEGQKAFNQMIDKIKPQGGRPIEAQVLSLDTINAVALPGDKIYLFDGMLQKANSPDEIAGVMAHEIGHAHNRDVMRTLMQTGGRSFLLGLLFGDFTGSSAIIFVTQTLLDASHSREAETAADDFAVATMTRLKRSAVPMGEFLKRLSGDDTATIIDSHPVGSARLERIRQSDIPTTGSKLLSDEEWRALKVICSGAP